MSKKSKKEYLQKIYIRYKNSEKEEKQKILDEFCNVCGYNRKYAIRLLNEVLSKEIDPVKKRAGPKKKYWTIGIIKFIKTLWIRTNLICSERLIACIPIWIEWYKKKISPLSKEDEALIRSISSSTIDRILKNFRGKYKKRGLCVRVQ
jgi:hypothetical protein